MPVGEEDERPIALLRPLEVTFPFSSVGGFFWR
jgi:hypothetical protein